MIANLTYKYRIYFNSKQERIFKNTSLAEIKLYNILLDKAKSLNIRCQQKNELTPLLNELIKDKNSKKIFISLPISTPQLILKRLHTAIRKQIKINKTFPIPKNENNIISIPFNPTVEQLKLKSYKKNMAYLFLNLFGIFKMVYHRPFPKGTKCSTAVIKKYPNNQYYIFFMLQGNFGQNIEIRPIPLYKTIGLDFSIKHLFVSSDNEIKTDISQILENRRQQKLIKIRTKSLQRKISISGSHSKAKLIYCNLLFKIKNKRIQYFNEISNNILEKYDLIALETINIESIKTNKHYGSKIMKLGFTQFVKILTYKANLEGKHIIHIPVNYPSTKRCNTCGYIINSLKIFEKTWQCPNCHAQNDRDINAACNIRDYGNKLYNHRI